MIQVRNIFLILILMLSVLFVPALLGTSIIDLQEEDDLTDTEDDDFSLIDFPPTWIRIPVHQMSVLLRLGMSIFALFVVYLGGRSKHRRFNDRTLDHVNALISYSLKTALFRAVFNFLFPILHLNYPNRYLVNRFSPILILNSRRY
jgi:ABC-type multidrug transport system fused ATPase/permease subunit